MEHSPRRQGGRRRRGAAGAVAVLALSGLACVTTSRPLPDFGAQPAARRTTVQVFDPSGQPEGEPVVVGSRPELVGSLRANPWAERPQDKPAAAEPGKPPVAVAAPQGEGVPQGEPQERLAPQDLYALFGPRIVIHGDGRVTKSYYVDEQTSAVLEKILALSSAAKDEKTGSYRFAKGAPEQRSVLDTLLGGSEIIVDVVKGFDKEAGQLLGDLKFTKAFPSKGGLQPADVTNDLVLVTATPDGLEAFEQTMDLFYRSVPQILIEAKVVEFARSDTLDIGVSQVDGNTPTVRTRGKGQFIKSIVSGFPNAAAGVGASEGLLTLGGIHDNLELNAVLELLQTEATSDIISQPRIAVRNGGVAIVDTRTRLPYPEARISGQNVSTNINFLDVGVTMQIRPDVAPGETVRLQIFASVDAVTGYAATDPIPTPEVSSRVARTTVHVPSGKTTVIGGLIRKNRFENESKVPLLGDIPLLGYLFRSTYQQTGSSEVVFMITPRIIYGFEGVELEQDYAGGGF